MKHLYKRIIIVASYAILGIAVIALTVTLILTTNRNAELNSKNAQLQTELDDTEMLLKVTKKSLENSETELYSVRKELREQKNETDKYNAECKSIADALQDQITHTMYWMYTCYGMDFPSQDFTVGEFTKVSDLLTAIRKNPTLYNGKMVSVCGTILKNESMMALSDASLSHEDYADADDSGYLAYYYFRNSPSIYVYVPDDVLYTVARSGDYVIMFGTVTISNGEIYLSNCAYEMITMRK